MSSQQKVVSNASAPKRPYPEAEDVEQVDDIFQPKYAYHVARMRSMIPVMGCYVCISNFYANKERIKFIGRRSRMEVEFCENCTRGNIKMSQVYSKYFARKQ